VHSHELLIDANRRAAGWQSENGVLALAAAIANDPGDNTTDMACQIIARF